MKSCSVLWTGECHDFYIVGVVKTVTGTVDNFPKKISMTCHLFLRKSEIFYAQSMADSCFSNTKNNNNFSCHSFLWFSPFHTFLLYCPWTYRNVMNPSVIPVQYYFIWDFSNSLIAWTSEMNCCLCTPKLLIVILATSFCKFHPSHNWASSMFGNCYVCNICC